MVNFIFVTIARDVTRSFHIAALGHKHEISSHGKFCSARAWEVLRLKGSRALPRICQAEGKRSSIGIF